MVDARSVGDGSIDAFAGPAGLALRVDGTGYVTIDSLCGSLTGPFTIAGWVQPSSVQVDPGSCVFGVNTLDGNLNLSLVMWDDPTKHLDYFDDFFTNRVETGVTSAPDGWRFFAATLDTNGNAATYQDGELSSTAQTARTVVPPCLLSLGQEWDGAAASDFFVGAFDEVTFWRVAKPQPEIQALMVANAVGDEPDLVGRFTFDANDARDDSGHGNAGTLVGTATIVSLP